MTQWHYLLWLGDPLTFKPVFNVRSDGSLKLAPIAVNAYDDFIQATKSPADVLQDGHYLPNKRKFGSRVHVSFPYTASVGKLAAKVISEVDWTKVSVSTPVQDWNYPAWYDSPEGRSMEKVELNTAIVGRFAEECGTRGRRCVVLLFPDADAMRAYADDGSEILQDVLEPLRGFIEVWDSTEVFGTAARAQGVCYYLGPNRGCGGGGHFNKDGYALLAQFFAERIRATSPDLGVELGSRSQGRALDKGRRGAPISGEMPWGRGLEEEGAREVG
jgi:hypothetical protein